MKDDDPDVIAALNALGAKLDELILLQRMSLLGPDAVLSLVCDDKTIKMYLPEGDTDFVQRTILKTRKFFEERQLTRVRKYIPKDAVVYDLGANIGNHSVYFAAICEAKKVVSFEAQAHCHSILSRNIELNALGHVTAHHCLLGTEGGAARMKNQNIGNLGATSFVATNTKSGTIPMRAVDEFGLSEDKLDFIKIDVEGMQIPVLTGALETLAKHKPTLWIELRERFNEVEETSDFLAEHGYARTDTLGPHDHIFTPS